MRMYKAFDGGKVIYLATRQEARKYRSLGSVEVELIYVTTLKGRQLKTEDKPYKNGFLRHHPSNGGTHAAEYYEEIHKRKILKLKRK